MIKINLLKSFATGATSSEGIQFSDDQNSTKVNFLKHIFVMILGIGALFAYENYNIPELNKQLSFVQDEINQATTFNQRMEGLKKEIERYEADLKRLNTQTEFLQKVQKERLLSADLINKMKDSITPKVWLNSITVVDTAIEIHGDAESIGDVNEFNNRLASATYLKDVLTTSIERKANSKINLPLQTFHIKASYVDGKQLLDNGSNEVEKKVTQDE